MELPSPCAFDYFKIWQQLRQTKPPNVNVSAFFIDHLQDSNSNLSIELPNTIKYFHSADDISCKLFQVNSLYFNTKLVQDKSIQTTFYEKEMSNLITDVSAGFDNTVMLYGPEDEDKDWILYGEMYDLGILHQFVKKVLEEIMLEDKIQKASISCVCHIHGVFYDLLNNNRQLKLVKDEQVKSILLGVNVKLECYKEYIKLMRLIVQQLRVLNCNLEELVTQISKHKSFNPNYTLVYEVKCQSKGQIQKTRFVRFGHQSNIKNSMKQSKIDYRKIENWSIRLNNLLRQQKFYQKSIQKDDCFLKYISTIIYQSNSRLNIILSLNKKNNKSSQYLNTLQFGSYFPKITPILTSKIEERANLYKQMKGGVDSIYEIDMPKLIDDIRQLANLKALRDKTSNQIYQSIFLMYQRVIFKECDSLLYQKKIIKNQQILNQNKAMFNNLVKTEKGIIEIVEKYQDINIKHIYLLIHFVLEGITQTKLQNQLTILSTIKFRCKHAKVPQNTPLSCPSLQNSIKSQNLTQRNSSIVKKKEDPVKMQQSDKKQRKPIVKYQLDELISLSFGNNTIAYIGDKARSFAKKSGIYF